MRVRVSQGFVFLGRGAGGAHTSICAKSPATLIVVVSVGLLLATVGTVGIVGVSEQSELSELCMTR